MEEHGLKYTDTVDDFILWFHRKYCPPFQTLWESNKQLMNMSATNYNVFYDLFSKEIINEEVADK